jgi:hypothetical protein
MTALDDLYAWVLETLSQRLGDGGPLVAFPVVAAGLLLMARTLIWRLLPLLLGFALALADLVTVLLGVLLLGVDFLLASCFRLCRLRPPAVVYGLGDTVVTATKAAQTGIRILGGRTGRLRRLSGTLILMLVVGLVWWWDAGYCARSPAGGCTTPISSWLRLVMP